MKTFQPRHNLAARLEISSSQPALDLDCAGVCRHANEVACHFLTMEWLANGDLVFALGETQVTADPLAVLCVRHYLRRRGDSLAIRQPTLAVAAMNALIYDCCAASCSLSCFYGRYSRATKILCYVNAGHDAPVLIRSNPDEVFRLETGGPVFGLQETPHYAEGLVQLKTGDRLAAFTGGIIDSLAAQRSGSIDSVLISMIRSHGTAGSSQLVNFIVGQCERASSSVQLDASLFVACVEDVRSSCYAGAAVESDPVFVEV